MNLLKASEKRIIKSAGKKGTQVGRWDGEGGRDMEDSEEVV